MSITNTLTLTNTLAYYGIRTLWIRNGFIVQAPRKHKWAQNKLVQHRKTALVAWAHQPSITLKRASLLRRKRFCRIFCRAAGNINQWCQSANEDNKLSPSKKVINIEWKLRVQKLENFFDLTNSIKQFLA